MKNKRCQKLRLMMDKMRYQNPWLVLENLLEQNKAKALLSAMEKCVMMEKLEGS